MYIPTILITLGGFRQSTITSNNYLNSQSSIFHHTTDNTTIKLGVDSSNSGIYYVAWESSSNPCNLVKRAVIGPTPCDATFNIIDHDGKSETLLNFEGCHGRGTDISVESITKGGYLYALCRQIKEPEEISCPSNPWDNGEDVRTTFECKRV